MLCKVIYRPWFLNFISFGQTLRSDGCSRSENYGQKLSTLECAPEGSGELGRFSTVHQEDKESRRRLIGCVLRLLEL